MNGPVAIRGYGVGGLHDPGAGPSVTLGEVEALLDGAEGFVVRDAWSGEDNTRSVLQQFIIEWGRHG